MITLSRTGEASRLRFVHARLGTRALPALLWIFGAMVGFGVSAANAPAQRVTQRSALFSDLHYRSVGPSRGGRVTTVAGHPAHPFTFYMGSTGGGVWKTEDYGTTWRPISDGSFATGSIGSIRVAPSDPDIVYVGTGSDAIRSNVIVGKGVYRSDDAGTTWRHLDLEAAGQIGAIEVHPTDPDVAYAAALGSPWAKNAVRGVFRTRNGGITWERVLFTSDSVGAIDLELNPNDPDEIYAALWRGQRKPWTIISGMEASGREDGIWKSTDGGDTWRLLTDGLPTGLIGKIDLAVSADDPDRVYALVETTDPDEGLYRSDDRGESWELVSSQRGLMNRPFYYTNVTADPSDADRVFVNNEGFYVSTDGGHDFDRLPTPHGDNHDLWINPANPDIWIQSNDGGANVTLDGGRTWSAQDNQPTAELYQVDVDDRFPYWLYAGQQDNSTIAVPSDPPAEASASGYKGYWKTVGGCETGPAVPKPGDPDIVYANCKGRFGRFSRRTGQEQQNYVGFENLYGANPADLEYRFQRVVPIEVSPHDPNTVYHGSQFVHRSTDEGRTWERISPDLTAFRPDRQVVSGGPITRDITGEEHYSVLYVIEESPVQAGVIWTGANDGPVHLTRDGGATWLDVTPRSMPREGRIQAIEPSPHDAAKAYVAGYRTLLGDFRPFIYATDDFGEHWRLLTPGDNGIPPDYPTRVVREDPEREGLLYAGTEFGMFISFDDGGRWAPWQFNLPVTPVTDIEIVDDDLVLSTMGRGFWIMDDLSPVRQSADVSAHPAIHLFQPDDAVRVRGGFRGFGARGPESPEWSVPGAVVDFYLADTVHQVVLEFVDARGVVVRRFEEDGAPAMAGIHRFVWDLRVPGPGDAERGGPLVVPGAYEVRMSAGDEVRVRTLTVAMDPRVAADGVTVEDLREQFDLALDVQEAIAAARAAIDRVKEAIDNAADGSDLRRELGEIRAVLETDGSISSYPRPMLADQLQYLYFNAISADQRPTRDMRERLQELKEELTSHEEHLARLLETIAERP